MTDETPPILSPATQASVQNLGRAKNDLAAWTKNLEQALADDLAADPPRLTADQAAKIAHENEVKAPPAPKPKEEPKAQEHKAEPNHKPDDDENDNDNKKKPAPAPPPTTRR